MYKRQFQVSSAFAAGDYLVSFAQTYAWALQACMAFMKQCYARSIEGPEEYFCYFYSVVPHSFLGILHPYHTLRARGCALSFKVSCALTAGFYLVSFAQTYALALEACMAFMK